MPIGRALEQRAPPLRLGFVLPPNRLLHLGKLEADQLVLLVARSVVLDEERECLVVAPLADEPTGCLGHELNRDEDVERQGDLEDVRDAPAPRVGPEAGAEDDPRGDDQTEDVVRVLIGQPSLPGAKANH
jgi:hypothetical protein